MENEFADRYLTHNGWRCGICYVDDGEIMIVVADDICISASDRDGACPSEIVQVSER